MSTPRYRMQTLDRRLYGVVSALVEDNEDPAHEGRVKLRFQWMDDTTVTDWCRVAQPYAGKGYGALFVPEKGDEVLAAFVHGEMSEPVVIGGLYNGEDKPAAHKDGARQDRKLIRTKGGHELLLEDSAQKKQVRLTSHAGHQVILDDAAKTVTVESAGGQKIEIDAAGKITVEGAAITLHASQVKIGSEAALAEPLVLGTSFMALYNLHTHQLGLAPTTPPVAPMTPAQLSGKAFTEK